MTFMMYMLKSVIYVDSKQRKTFIVGTVLDNVNSASLEFVDDNDSWHTFLHHIDDDIDEVLKMAVEFLRKKGVSLTDFF